MRSSAFHRIVTWKAAASAAALTLAAGGCGPESLEDATPRETGVEQAAVSVTARSADAFVDSVGVNMHLHFSDKVYAQAYSTIIKPRLQELGIRHVRDGAYTYDGINRDSFYYQRCRELAALGIRFNLITSMQTSHGTPTNYALLDDIYGWCDNAVVSFEGVNEPDIQGVSDWQTTIRSAQRTLFETVKGNATIKHLRVLGPSVTGEAAANSLGDISAYMDQGNVHNYYGGRHPETTGWGGNGYGSLTWQFNYMAKPVSGTKPVSATETGWHNALSTTDGHRATPEKIVGRYMPRMLLSHFARGLGRSYPYEFIDQGTSQTDQEASFGLLRNNGTPKPSFTALKNVLALLKDPGASFTPGALDYALSGSTANVQHVLLQKREGTFYLAIWLGVSSWNPDTKTESTVAPQAVTLSLPTSIATATVYTLDDTGAMASTKKSVAGSLGLTLTDRVTFVAVKPGI